jgi:hypothetical protein
MNTMKYPPPTKVAELNRPKVPTSPSPFIMVYVTIEIISKNVHRKNTVTLF